MPRFDLTQQHNRICAALILFWAALASAATIKSDWLTRPWQTDDGLPNNTVNGVAQTPDGYLWLGTPTGLARFDGVNFQEFPSTNYVANDNRGILVMIGSLDGGLRFAMDRGAVVLLNPDSAQVFLPKRDLPDEVPYMLAEDGDGALWVTYRSPGSDRGVQVPDRSGGSVCRIKDGKITLFSDADGLPSPGEMCAITTDSEGQIWFAQGGHFGAFRDGRFQTIEQLERNPTSLAAAREGGIWVCCGTQLGRFTEKQGIQWIGEYAPGRPGAGPTCLLEDQEGDLWIGTLFSGLFHFDGSEFSPISTSHREVTCLTEDHEGNIWVGTTGGGLNRIRPRVVSLEGTEAGLPFEAVQSLCEDPNGVIWAATQNGNLARRSGARWEPFTPAPRWVGEATCVNADSSGAIWIGTLLRGLFCWKDNHLVSWGNPELLKGKTIHTLVTTEKGDLWIGEDTPNAIQRLHGRNLITIATPPEEDLRVVRAMTEDAHGNVWIGTSRGLLMRSEGDRVVDVTAKTSGSLNSIRCLSATPDGSVWVGYAGWGVGRWKDGHFGTITSMQGLLDDYISHILADGRGWIWFGCDRGIFKVRQAELEAVAEGRASSVRSIHYGRGEGLPSLQANFGGAPAAMQSRDGRLWIPMRTALAVINPNNLRENSDPPPVLLQRTTVDDRVVAFYSGVVPLPKTGWGDHVLDLRSPGGELRLPPGHRRVQFEFTALSYTAPENVHFRYRLDGFDNNWVEGGTERVAPYSRLPSGKYQFHVIACNSDGVWNESGAVLGVVVLPFFWETWWFRLSTLALFTVSVAAAVWYVSHRRLRFQLRRFEQQEALHRERARIAKDIHDDVGANLTQIALLGVLAQEDWNVPGKSMKRLDTISRTARQAVRSLDEIVWAVNPRNDTLTHLIDYAGQFALDYLRVAGIRCRLDFPEEAPQREVSTDVRHNLFLVVKEALNNIVKHAHATEVWFRVHVTDGALKLTIEDNGCGFERAPDTATEDGLRNMKQRVADIGGRCEIESSPGAGARVTVELPWRSEKQQ